MSKKKQQKHKKLLKQNKPVQKNKDDSKYFKGRYHIVFYDKTGEKYIAGFDTIVEICRYKKWDVTKTNINILNIELYRALKFQNHFTEMLNGNKMTVYLVDMLSDEDEEEIE